MKKNKNIAGLLALFLGWSGAHRFYLGQKKWGFSYAAFTGMVAWASEVKALGFLLKALWIPLVLIVSLVDAITFFSMDERRFDEKYNGIPDDSWRQQARRPGAEKSGNPRNSPQQRPRMSKRQARATSAAYKKLGKKKFEEYDYDGAIQDFKLSLEIVPNDLVSHFNLACAYSLTEDVEKSLHHLELAVRCGFKDFQKIKEHPALAYLRIQPPFEAFEQNGFRMPKTVEAASIADDDLLNTKPDLLDQLKKLGDLRKKGFLTEKEFELRKRELLA